MELQDAQAKLLNKLESVSYTYKKHAKSEFSQENLRITMIVSDCCKLAGISEDEIKNARMQGVNRAINEEMIEE